MAETFKVRYKNHCTPQEQILTSGRWYLDSDSGKRLTGDSETVETLSATGTYTTGVLVTTLAGTIASNVDFVYIKNTGTVEILITLNDSNYVILLSAGEAFASSVTTHAIVKAKTASGTSTLEYYKTT